ncbi:MAG: FAD-dependent oxidoreductase, partial [Actinobacteria bacterium]|nr:FAD-dependent oxidoreductase [Actinomycetota bacterium]
MSEKQNLDVLVVGGGPAGLTCATETKSQLNASTMLAERAEYFGGTPQSTYHLGFGVRDLHRVMTGPNYADKLEQRARNQGVLLKASTTVLNWTPQLMVDLAGENSRYEVQARAIVLATGVRERSRHARLVPGDRGAGVYTTGALQRLVYQLGAKVGKRAVVV